MLRPASMCASFSLVSLGLFAMPLGAQQALTDPGQKTVRVVRTDTPPVIDGDLGDAVWERAAYVDDLHQTLPVEYAEPSERTEIYILYDDNALYVGVRLHDAEPDLITANNMRQNDQVWDDDRFFVMIDPFNERRSGYYFGVNPNGVRNDGLYRNISQAYRDWNSIFDVAAGRFEGGWTAEYEIPLQVDLLRSHHRHLGNELLARHRAPRREPRLGIPRPGIRPVDLGTRRWLRRARTGARARRRAVGQRHRGTHFLARPPCGRPLGHESRTEPGRLLQADAPA